MLTALDQRHPMPDPFALLLGQRSTREPQPSRPHHYHVFRRPQQWVMTPRMNRVSLVVTRFRLSTRHYSGGRSSCRCPHLEFFRMARSAHQVAAVRSGHEKAEARPGLGYAPGPSRTGLCCSPQWAMPRDIGVRITNSRREEQDGHICVLCSVCSISLFSFPFVCMVRNCAPESGRPHDTESGSFLCLRRGARRSAPLR